jgi:hypothetical protein
MNYYGEYNRYGYTIYDETGDEVYRAGNLAFDSVATVYPLGDHALDINTIGKYCAQTGREIASENGGHWSGRTRVHNYDD